MKVDLQSIDYDNWFRGNMEFPRRVLVIKPVKTDSFKYQVDNEADLLEYMRRENYTNCYCQIFSNRQVAEATFDTMYLDIDVHEEKDEEGRIISYDKRVTDAFIIFKSVIAGLEKSNVKISRAYFTGRGFAVYIDFDPIKFASRMGYKFAVRSFLMESGIFELLDSSVLGDVERVSRMPNTINGNTENGMMCVQIDPEWSLERIVDASKLRYSHQVKAVKHNDFGQRLKSIETSGAGMFNTIEGENVERTPVYGEHTKYKNFPKCMKGFYDEIAKTGELDHYQRVNLAIFLMKVWGFDKAKQVLSWASDYKEGKTTYQMNYLRSKGIKVYACKKMQNSHNKDGSCWCPYTNLRECPAYRVSNGWLEKILPSYKKEDLNKSQ